MLPSLLIILLLEGFITISVEILTMRQLMPFFGGSVIITSIIIGCFLLFLALGYWRGGFYRQDFFKHLSRNFLFSMMWLGIGLSYSFIAIFSYVTTVTLSLSFLVSLSLYLVSVIAPIVFWLGQTIPITTNLFNQTKAVSEISGSALFLSTIGSFLGAIVTSLVFFQYFGVAWAIVINCALLLSLILLLKKHNALLSWHIVVLCFALFLIKNLNVDAEKLKFLLTNNYGNYEIKEVDSHTKLLKINESSSSLLSADKSGFPYIQFMRNLLFTELNLQHKKILIIGAGGFSLTAAGANNNDITYVDIDPAIKTLAETVFLNQAINGIFFGQDARLFLRQTSEKYEVIVSDVYSHEMAIPPALLTVEYFQQIANHLNDQGLLLVNVIANPLFKDRFSQRIHNTLHQVFNYCAIFPLGIHQELSNVIYLCKKTPSDSTVYSDNLNNATFDFFASRQRLYSH